MEDIVDTGCGLCHLFSSLWRETGWSDFLYLTVILGIVIEELIAGYHLGSWQYHGLLCSLVDALGNLNTIEEAFNHNLVALHECYTESWSQLVGILHLAYTEATAVSSRLHETRHTDALGNLVLIILFATTEQDTVCHVHAETAQVIVEHILVEGHCLYQHTTCRVWQVDKVEVSLHHTILTRLSVDGNISIIEVYMLAILYERKVVLIDFGCLAIIESHVPVGTLYIDQVNIVSLFVEE